MTDLDIAQRLVRTEHSARARGKDFDISFTKMKSLLTAKKCYISGRSLQSHDPTAPDYLTIERLDNDKGYVEDNVVACSKVMNGKKGDLTVQEITMLYKALKRKNII